MQAYNRLVYDFGQFLLFDTVEFIPGYDLLVQFLPKETNIKELERDLRRVSSEHNFPVASNDQLEI